MAMRRRLAPLLIVTLCTFLFHSDVNGQSSSRGEVTILRNQVQHLQETVEQLQQTILQMQRESTSVDQELKQQVDPVKRRQAEALSVRVDSPLDLALDELGIPDTQPDRRALWTQPLGGNTQLRLIDISADVLFYAGGSSERDEAISTLQGGAHDPNQRGFTLAQAEFSFSGAIDPYFTGETHVIASFDPGEGGTVFELEEAFLTSTALPYGLQLEVGHFFTEFGIINPQHPHEWDWVDQPIINSRMFGGDGMRQTGFRTSWLAPTPWFSEFHFGMQNADGGAMPSFLGGELGGHGHGDEEEEGHAEDIEGDGIAGRPIVDQHVRGFGDFVYLTRWRNSFDLTDELTGVFGFSGLHGPNATGRDGDTWIYGLDMKWRWTPASSFRGYPFLTWQTEIMKRDYHAARFTRDAEDGDIATLPGRTLNDWGLYTQLLYGFYTNWAAGLRYEYGGGSGRSITGRKNDPFRDDRHRVSPLLTWRQSEFSRIRLQYNYDMATHLEDDAHTIWLGFEWIYGAHPTHNF